MADYDEELFALLLADEAPVATTIVPRREHGPAPLSFAQQRLWFLQRYAPQAAAYNLTRALRLRGVLEPAAREQAVAARLQAQARLPFDLSVAPLLRATLLRLGNTEHVLLLGLHHIVSDAWSNPVLARDLAAFYGAARTGAEARLPPLPVQYADYAVWQRSRLQGERFRAGIDYWKDYLGEPPPLALPVDRPRPARQTYNGGRVRLPLAPALARAAREFCRAEGCTPFVLLLATWQILLGRYSGQDSFAIGVPNAARGHWELEELVGFFVNTQVYRARLAPDLTIRALCRRLAGEARAALDHADFPFELLLEHLAPERDTSRSPLFQVLFNLQTQAPAVLTLPDVQVEAIPVDETSAKFDLTLDIAIEGDAINCELEYNTDLFENRVREAPECAAAVFGSIELSYAELNRRANRLAHWLRGAGVDTDRLLARGVRLLNVYGPTETTVWSAAWPVARIDAPVIPIGRPIANNRLYILDERLKPVPPGVTGELYIGGAGVARGYARRPELSAAAFLPNPFALAEAPGAGPGSRLYRTGDLARYSADGTVEFLGRRDFQVKIRGFRIELGEIEAALEAHPSVRQAVITVQTGPGGQELLAAYLVPQTDAGADPSQALAAFLAERLPAYMVPAVFTPLPALPLNANGKVDRKALPPPVWQPVREHEPPATDTEVKLAAIWEDVLGVSGIGARDNIFALGAQSLQLVRVQARLLQAFGCDIPLPELFRAPTLRAMASCIESAGGGEEGGDLAFMNSLLETYE